MRSRAFQTEIPNYLLAAALVAAAGFLHAAMARLDGNTSPLMVLLPAVVLSAWLGGFGPGLLATGLGVIAARWVSSGGAALSITNDCLFVVAGAGISWLTRGRRMTHSTEVLITEDRSRLEHMNGEVTQAIDNAMSRERLSERMASLGTLSSGLGHDIGNLLLPIRLRLDAMATKGVPPQFRDDVAAIATCADHLQRIANGLRLISMDPTQANAPAAATDLYDWWPDAAPVLKNSLPRGTELQRDFPDDLPPVAIPRHVLTQALFNLVQNAGQAMTTATRGVVRIWAELDPHDQMVHLGVSDNGPGMTNDIRQRCLEPFFTSKPRALSTGLGLTLVHATVKSIGGDIDIQSEPGQGTTIVLSIPAATADNEARAGCAERASAPRAVIVVQDARIGTFIGAVLKSAGFDIGYDDAPDDESVLLVVDDSVSTAAVKSFLDADADHRCLILGDRPDTNALKGVVRLGEQPTPAAVRSAIGELTGRLAQAV